MLIGMEHVVINLRRRHHTSRIVQGSDLNVSLAPKLEGLTGSRIHPNAKSASSRWREAVTEWVHSLRLRAACTFDHENTGWHNVWDYEEKWIHENSNKGGEYQLDYFLVSNYVRGEASVVRGYDLGSDHPPIHANLRLEHKELWGTAKRMEYSQKGWSTRTEEAKLNFMKGVAKDFCWMDDRARGKALLLVEEINYSHAIEADSNNVAIRQWNNYRNDENDEVAQQERLIRLQLLAQREIEAGWQPPVVKFHDFLNTLASANNCKQLGSDGVVAEMVRALSWTSLFWLYLLFLVRLGGWETEKPEACSEVILFAIPKKTDKVGLQSMRYISLLLVLQKF